MSPSCLCRHRARRRLFPGGLPRPLAGTSLPYARPAAETGACLREKAARFALSHCSRKNRHNLQHLEPETIIALDQLDKENEQFLNDLVDALPESDRLVVGLYRAGYEAPDIARFLGTSTNAVSQRYRRAVAKMKAIVEKENNLLKKEIR